MRRFGFGVGFADAERAGRAGVISDELIAEIAATVPPAIGTFLLTSRQSVREIVAQQRSCRTNTIFATIRRLALIARAAYAPGGLSVPGFLQAPPCKLCSFRGKDFNQEWVSSFASGAGASQLAGTALRRGETHLFDHE
jgi:hypothetical protein